MVIEIVNPVPGGQRYTSLKRASNFLSRGIAVMEHGRLRFLDQQERKRNREVQDDAQSFRANRGDRVYWNGDRGSNATYPPGVVIS